jgi:hypothetical protein
MSALRSGYRPHSSVDTLAEEVGVPVRSDKSSPLSEVATLKLLRAPFGCLRRTYQRESHGRLVTDVAVGPRAASAVSASSVSARSTSRRCDDPSFSGTGQARARTALSLHPVTAGVFEEVWRTGG